MAGTYEGPSEASHGGSGGTGPPGKKAMWLLMKSGPVVVTYEGPSEASHGGSGGWPPRKEGDVAAYEVR